MDYPGLYFALVVLVLIVALWFVLLIVGFAFKVAFFALIVLVGVAAYRAWRGTAPRAR
jgi:hypothetical protein